MGYNPVMTVQENLDNMSKLLGKNLKNYVAKTMSWSEIYLKKIQTSLKICGILHSFNTF